MNKVQLSELLDKYFNGTCTPEEMDAIDSWYSQYNDAPGFTDNLPNPTKEELKAKMFSAISVQIAESEPAVVRPIYRKWWVGAAAAVLFVSGALFYLNKSAKPVIQQQIANVEFSFTNHSQHIVKQLLPDSSVVWLSPNAGLSWPKHFGAATRNVEMTGNCFFEITKSPQHPFIISSEHIVTKVWGTSFRVIDGKDVSAAKVTVVSGKVSVSKKGSQASKVVSQLAAAEVMLHPNEQVILKNNTGLITTKQADISDLTLYKHFSVSFDNAKLAEIVSVLNKKFDVKIIIQNEKLDKAAMTADLTDLNLPEVLEVLKASMKLDYEVANGLIILKKTN